jgi:hypothetical protein
MDAIAGNLPGRQLVQGISHTRRRERPWVPREDRSNGFGTGPIDTTFGNGIFTVQTGAAIGMATTTGFEAVAVERHAFALGAGAARGIVMQFANLQCGCAQ